MIRLISARFHPDLEEALVAEVRTAKQVDPLRPLAILVPSHQLARRVKWLLAVEHRLTLLGIHVLTFHQLALTLLRESRETLPLLVKGAFREELLRLLVAGGVAGTEAFQHLTRIKGVWSGLRATVDDLKEARVDLATAWTALDDGLLGKEEPARLRTLLALYSAVLQKDRELGIADPDDLAELAAGKAAGSTFLRRMAAISYYGFYDLTQSQLDFFQAVAAAHTVTVFFPLEAGNPLYGFAQRFLDTYLVGMTGADAEHDQSAHASPMGSFAEALSPEVRAGCRIFSAVGLEDEVTVAAKEILRLIEDERMDPMEIGVVARMLDPVLPVVRRIFESNRIPWACPTGEPLIHAPLVKTLLQFIGLRASAFPRAAVLDVLTSPCCRLSALCASGAAPRPDQWDWITRRLNIACGNPEDGGLGDWLRLEQMSMRDLEIPIDEKSERRRQALPRQQVGLLWDLVRGLQGDLGALPARARWSEYTDRFMEILPRWFSLDAWEQGVATTHDDRVQLAIKDCLLAVRSLDLLQEDVSLQDWSEHVVREIERARLPSENADLPGVQVLDAMGARGTRFRALFVLDMNETVFPRSIREDAFLRDADREVWARDLGFKIPRKLEGFDEERLLFTLLLNSARQRLYLGYQRADRAGRAMIPSGYLVQLQRELGAQEWSIKRRPSERWTAWPYHAHLLTPAEMSLRTMLQGSYGPPYRALVPAAPMLEEGLRALAGQEGSQSGLTAYDGAVGKDMPHWQSLVQNGVSPSALERYARCPFQYYAAQVLRLVPLPAPEAVDELEVRTRGALCHEILRRYYEYVLKSGTAIAEIPRLLALDWLAQEAAAAFAEFEQAEPIGYPLLWILAKEEITSLLSELVLSDLQELSETDYVPTFFEAEASGSLRMSSDAEPILVHGVLDRVDVRRTRGQIGLRVVDYKYTQSTSITSRDRDLNLAAARGFRLQLPLYLLAARSLVANATAAVESAALYFLAPQWADGSIQRKQMEASCWEGDTGTLIRKTVDRILDGIRGGRFTILPGEYCDHCDFSAVCRYTHDPSRRRARADTGMKALKELRIVKMGRSESEPNDVQIVERRKKRHG